ncbi:hemolysin family protein [uncultured Corynebacterium sp.]|uniref:hemolysin family protein n=1 Tax=uncultured Corynebacterium sp. TaxID=159447 RepID=UPI00260A45A3|nr:hemolysin family protein [uncultured Corynebacterium sp.]
MTFWTATLLIIVLLLVNAFFVGGEFALISSRKDRLETLISQGNQRARTVLDAMEHLSLMLAAAQLGITIASLILGKLGEPAVAHLLECPFASLNIPPDLLHPLSFAIALFIITFLHILLGEMVPKNLAIAGPESTALILVPLLIAFEKITRPFIHFLNWIARMTLKAFGIEQKDELDATVDSSSLAAMIAESRSEGLIDAEEHVRLKKALAVARRSVKELCIPLDKVISLPLNPTVTQLEAAVAETGFSRFPVRSTTGFVGYIHVKDVLEKMVSDDPDAEDEIIERSDIRSLKIMDAATPMDDALRILRRDRAHMGLITENGKILGVVAMEDLIEEYVGTVRDWTHE